MSVNASSLSEREDFNGLAGLLSTLDGGMYFHTSSTLSNVSRKCIYPYTYTYLPG